MTAIATDDAHFRHGEYDAFGGFVAVKAESLEPEALLAALKGGNFYSSQGPRIHDVSFSANEASVDCSPVQAITLVTGTSRALAKVGRQIVGATFDLTNIGQNNRAKDAPATWARVTIIDAAGRRAWTNPIWVDDFKS